MDTTTKSDLPSGVATPPSSEILIGPSATTKSLVAFAHEGTEPLWNSEPKVVLASRIIPLESTLGQSSHVGDASGTKV